MDENRAVVEDREARRAVHAAAEAALLSRRSPEELAGDSTPEEAAEIAAMEERLDAARAVSGAARVAIVAAQRAIDVWRPPTPQEATNLEKARIALPPAERAERDLLVARTRLHERINAARRVRREAAGR
jgi:hypothetical protein